MSVIAALEALPTSGVTVAALQTLDRIVPGEWSNTTSFNAIIEEVSGESSPAVIAEIRQKAMVLELQPGAPYAQALQLYGLADTVDQVAAGAAVASQVGALFGNLGFLEKFTPKPETTQSVDAAMKLITEILAFGRMNGVSATGPDGLARFVGALQDYARYDLIRIGGWVVFDGLLPLGPNFVQRISSTVSSVATSQLTSNPAFSTVSGKLPGDSPAAKQEFLVTAIDTTADWVGRFVEEHGLTQDKALSSLKQVMGAAGGASETLAAAIDATTTYTTHTGTQTVARTLARHATNGVKDEVWAKWVAARS